MKNVRFLIIGGGIAGAATAWFLARRGETSVFVVDKEDQLGSHSTAKNAGILRSWMDDDPTRALAVESATFLKNPPEGFCEYELTEPRGLVMMFSKALPPSFDEWAETQPAGSVRRLTQAEFDDLAPHFRMEVENAVFVGAEGHVDSAGVLAAFVAGASRAGIPFETNKQAREPILEDGRLVGIRFADGDEIRAEVIVNAAGGWAGPLGEVCGSTLKLHPRRRHILVTAVDERVQLSWPAVWSESRGFYAKPESGGLLMSSCDESEVVADACAEDDTVLESIAERAGRFVPDFGDAGAAHFWAGMRTFADDPRFVIGPDPKVEGLFWVAGLGGHGITCSAGVGRLATELLLGEAKDDWLAKAMDPGRFVGQTAGQ